ncbi:MAG: hypothetical protein WC860_00220 [Candidatus Margulisiibacteriota bacterium]|jgi:hypothetical protein
MKEITYIDPAILGKIFGCVMFGLTLLWIIPSELFLLYGLFFKGSQSNSFFIIWLFLIINPGIAYILGIILGYIYNIIAKWFGGIQIELKD